MAGAHVPALGLPPGLQPVHPQRVGHGGNRDLRSHRPGGPGAGRTPKGLIAPEGVPGVRRATPVSTSTVLEKWLTTGHRPPASRTVARPEDADPAALLIGRRGAPPPECVTFPLTLWMRALWK